MPPFAFFILNSWTPFQNTCLGNWNIYIYIYYPHSPVETHHFSFQELIFIQSASQAPSSHLVKFSTSCLLSRLVPISYLLKGDALCFHFKTLLCWRCLFSTRVHEVFEAYKRVCCGVRGRALASHTGCYSFESRGGRLSSSICWLQLRSIYKSWKAQLFVIDFN